jgi:hypothetical protein
MTNAQVPGKPKLFWFIDSGCSNHMTGVKNSGITLDESFKLKVRLGDKWRLDIEEEVLFVFRQVIIPTSC